jgi:hypothetical protein
MMDEDVDLKITLAAKNFFHLWKKVLELNKESNNQIGGGKKTNGDHATHSPKNA